MRKHNIIIKQRAHLSAYEPAQKLDLIVYWTTLLVLVIANLFVVLIIIPFLLLASGFQFYIIIAILGLFFGYIFSMLVHNIENIDMHHHMFAILFIPAFAMVNLFVMSTAVGRLALDAGITIASDPLPLSLSYAAFFAMPYLLSLIKERSKWSKS